MNPISSTEMEVFLCLSRCLFILFHFIGNYSLVELFWTYSYIILVCNFLYLGYIFTILEKNYYFFVISNIKYKWTYVHFIIRTTVVSDWIKTYSFTEKVLYLSIEVYYLSIIFFLSLL